MAELAQRMLTNRPTVARISESCILAAGQQPDPGLRAAYRNHTSEGCHGSSLARSQSINVRTNMPARVWKNR